MYLFHSIQFFTIQFRRKTPALLSSYTPPLRFCTFQVAEHHPRVRMIEKSEKGTE